MNTCACGCGETVTRTYRRGHNPKARRLTPKTRATRYCSEDVRAVLPTMGLRPLALRLSERTGNVDAWHRFLVRLKHQSWVTEAQADKLCVALGIHISQVPRAS